MCSAKRSAWTPENPLYCRQTKCYPNGRCKNHGGPTPSGMASPHFKTGRHSKHLPTRLIEGYQDALADKELMNLESEVALIDARIGDLMLRVDGGESGKLWEETCNAFIAYDKALNAGDKEVLLESLHVLRKNLQEGGNDMEAWREIHRLQDQRRKMVLAVAKQLELSGRMIDIRQANVLIAALLSVVNEEVSNIGELPQPRRQSVLANISTKFLRITATTDRKELTA